MTELWLLRHGKTDWNFMGRWQGQASFAPGLNDSGYVQALAAREQLSDVRFSAIYSSDLLRARQTAELIAVPLGLTVSIDARLREINLGLWEGMLSDEIEAQFPRELAERSRNPVHTRAPRGETPAEVADRILAALDEITRQHPNDAVLIVSHGISLAIIICHAQGIALDQIYEHIPENAQPFCIKWK